MVCNVTYLINLIYLIHNVAHIYALDRMFLFDGPIRPVTDPGSEARGAPGFWVLAPKIFFIFWPI